MSMLVYNNPKKKQISKYDSKSELDVNNNYTYKMKTVGDSTVYINKTVRYQLLKLYYLVSEKYYLKSKTIKVLVLIMPYL